ncbi:hypothetical protein HanRHA438_Chr16g0748971 [Helianthus annuus]|nr:hypothetical protein HanOQP8_Chr16g0607751 [Helianthus annuus]KAJ0834904.1 hypothetical protein HanRHA438_Chr16g0748971 [Helianthus annuus]
MDTRFCIPLDGSQEVAVEGQDKVFKFVIEPLENVSVNVFRTNKEDIRDLGSPQEVAEALIKKVLSAPTQKTKLLTAAEVRFLNTSTYTALFHNRLDDFPNFFSFLYTIHLCFSRFT